MARKDYDEIKNKFADYIRIWNTYDLISLKEIVDPWIEFNTSTSKTMTNGGQHSIFGVYDFINDFPKTDILYTKIYNFICRIDNNKAYSYAEVVCSAFNVKSKIDFFEFTVAIANQWAKKDNAWKMVNMRKEVIAERGNLQEYFESVWHFENEIGGRIQVVRGECDSPWLNIKKAEDVLSETEKVKECIIMNCFGEEWNSFTHCFEAISNYYRTYTRCESDGQRKKDDLSVKKAARQHKRYSISPMKFHKIEIEGNRAFVYVDRVRGLKQNSREYEYFKDNIEIEHTCCRSEYELVKEKDGWKIVYFNAFKGLYEVGKLNDGQIFGDAC